MGIGGTGTYGLAETGPIFFGALAPWREDLDPGGIETKFEIFNNDMELAALQEVSRRLVHDLQRKSLFFLTGLDASCQGLTTPNSPRRPQR